MDPFNIEKLRQENPKISYSQDIGLKPLQTDILSITLFLIKFVIIFCTVFGNGLVFLTVVTSRLYRRIPSNIFISSLAVTDFLVGVLVMAPDTFLLNIYGGCWYRVPTSVGYVARYIRIILIYSSIWHLCLITYDRYRYIHSSKDYFMCMVGCRVKGVLAISWGVPILVGAYRAITTETSLSRHKGAVRVILEIGYFALGNVTPYVTIMFCYIRIIMIAKRLPENWHSRRILGFQRRTLLISLLIFACYAAWIPTTIISSLEKLSNVVVPCNWIEIASWLYYLNSLINPFVYILYNPRFRNAMLRTLTCGVHKPRLPRRVVKRNPLKYKTPVILLKTASTDTIIKPASAEVVRLSVMLRGDIRVSRSEDQIIFCGSRKLQIPHKK